MQTWLQWDKDELMSRSLPNCVRFMYLIRNLRRSACINGSVLLIGGSTVYISMKSLGYNTHSYDYSWHWSSAFLAGTAPAAAMLALYILSSCIYIFQSYKFDCKMMGASLDLTQSPTNPNSGNITSDSKLEQKNSSISRPSSHSHLYALTLSLIMLLLNLIFITALNVAYVLSKIYLSRYQFYVTQIGVTLTKLLNINIVIPYMSRWLESATELQSVYCMRLQTLLYIFSIIVAPVFVTIFADEACYKSIISPSSAVTVSYKYSECGEYIHDTTTCARYLSSSSSYSLEPATIYNQQCSSDVLVNYVPILVYSYIFVAFLGPVLYVSATYIDITSRIYRCHGNVILLQMYEACVPNILR